jgi:catechol 2,3-dioxygenase-like lactoylglutathione lyase family enzyme
MDFLHVGMKVDDIHRSTELYRTLFGIDWEPVREYRLAAEADDGTVESSTTLVTHGKTASGFEIEMIQVLEGHTPDEVVLGSREGVSHFGFTVPDFDVAIGAAEARGLRKISEYRSEYVDFAFFSGGDLGGALAQLIQFNQPRH